MGESSKISYGNYDLYAILRRYDSRYMAVGISEQGDVQTSQAIGEEYGPEERKAVSQLPTYIRDKVHKNIITGQYIDKVYREFIDSTEGREYVSMLGTRGNGKSNPGRLEEIIVANAGEGLVAATMPKYLRANIIINADFIDNYCEAVSRRWGLNYDDVLKNVLVHEMNHYFLQNTEDLEQSEKAVEFDNDFKSIEFYMSLANKYPEKSEFYKRKAGVFTDRYVGRDLEAMQEYITANVPEEVFESEYRDAA